MIKLVVKSFGKCGKIKNYFSKISKLREKYSDKIEVLIGLEIAYSYLLKSHEVLPYDTLNKLDYILLENLDYIPSTTKLEDVGLLLSKFDCQKGLAHTDLPKLSQRFLAQGGLDYVLEFVKKVICFGKFLQTYLTNMRIEKQDGNVFDFYTNLSSSSSTIIVI